eukprot:EG_transcript_10948
MWVPLLATAAVGVGLAHWLYCIRRPTVTAGDADAVRAILSRCGALFRPYVPPPFFLGNGHVMTVLSSAIRTNPMRPLRRTLLQSSDGGVVAVDWLLGGAAAAGEPADSIVLEDSADAFIPAVHASKGVVLVLHGLTGSSRSPYISHVLRVLHDAGWTCAVMEARGCGLVGLRTEQMFSAGFTEDLRMAAAVVRRTMLDDQPLVAIGYSLGGNILAKYLGEEGSRAPITAAMTVGSPTDLLATSAHMSRPVQRHFYSRVLVHGLQNYFRRNEAALRQSGRAPTLGAVNKCSTVQEFDAAVIVPIFRYRDVEEYYADASSSRLLHRVARPLLLVDAVDDVITGCPFRAQRIVDALAANPNLAFAQTRSGGHVGFLEWPPLCFWRAPCWTDRVALQFAEAVRQTCADTQCCGV